jgi:hypothetical protein
VDVSDAQVFSMQLKAERTGDGYRSTGVVNFNLILEAISFEKNSNSPMANDNRLHRRMIFRHSLSILTTASLHHFFALSTHSSAYFEPTSSAFAGPRPNNFRQRGSALSKKK